MSGNVKNFYKKSVIKGKKECGVEFKYMQGRNQATIGSFLKKIKPISCENATELMSYESATELMPYENATKLLPYENKTLNSFTLANGLNISLTLDKVDVGHVGLAGAVAILTLSNMICCLCCLCRKKKSNRVSTPMA